MDTKNLQIEGMSCEHCVMAVKHKLSNLNKLIVKEVNIGNAKIEYDSELVPDVVLNEAVESAGYKLISVK